MRVPGLLPLCLLRCRALPHGSCVMHALQAFSAAALRHPAAADTFVPNDIQLGGERARFMLLTGANMGGKSTLLRQVVLCACSSCAEAVREQTWALLTMAGARCASQP